MKKSGDFKRDRSISNFFSLQALGNKNKPSLKEGLLVISLLLLSVFLLDHFGRETITAATSSGINGITGASHVQINTEKGLDKFKIQIHNSLEAYSKSTKTPLDKKNLVTATENTLDELYS